jgi:hypothetical protein
MRSDLIEPRWFAMWCLRQESNLYLSLRRTPFYPLNYEDDWREELNARPAKAAGARRDFIGFL